MVRKRRGSGLVYLILNMTDCHRSGRSSLGLPGRGVCSAGQHRTVQQPEIRQEPQQSRLPARRQLSAKCSGTASGPARGFPNELWPVAGAGGLLQTYILGRTAAVRTSRCQQSDLFFFNETIEMRRLEKPTPTVLSLIKPCLQLTQHFHSHSGSSWF